MNYIVSRHPGALEWIKQRLAGQRFECLTHVAPDFAMQPGDRFFGVLPLALVARIHSSGAQAWVLDIEMPPALRGQELDCAQMDALGARLVRYEARALPGVPGA